MTRYADPPSDRPSRRRVPPTTVWTISLVALITAGTLSAFFGLNWHWLVAWLASANVVTLLAFVYDKWRATRSPAPARRIPESSLLWCCSVGGTIGGLVAMIWRGHKTRDRRFQFSLGLILIAQALLIAYVIWRQFQ